MTSNHNQIFFKLKKIVEGNSFKYFVRNIAASNNTWVGIGAIGEGWHNYHHVFPWDYKTSELGDYNLNLSCMFIDFFAKIGKKMKRFFHSNFRNCHIYFRMGV